jgi:putative Holliday junction resolvase
MPETADGGSILSFDFGMRRIGVAVGQTTTRTASALATLNYRDQPPWQAIAELVETWRPSRFVVGLPLDAEGGETDMSKRARAFARALASRHGIDVSFADERLTSIAAESRFADLRAAGLTRRRQSKDLDALAARFILENWLQSTESRKSDNG